MNREHSISRPVRTLGSFGALITIATMIGCSGATSPAPGQGASSPGAGPGAAPPEGGSPPGAVIEHAGAGPMESQRFVVDPNLQARASEIRIAELSWGRLVDVYGLDAQGEWLFQQKDFVIGPAIASDGVDYLLEETPVGGVARLVILRDVTDASPAGGLEQFIDLLRTSEANLMPVSTQGPGGALFTMIPRNAAVVARFDDLLDADLVSSANLRVKVGVPPVDPFEYRALVDRNHGALTILPGETQRRFFTTRVLLDFTVGELEATGTALPLNPIGLPVAWSATDANFLLAVPTVEDSSVGQSSVLRNPTGAPVASSANGPVDFASPTVDVVRFARSGGPNDVTGDLYNGFLADTTPPRLVGEQPIEIGRRPQPDPNGNPFDFTLRQIRFDAVACAQAPERGDLIQIPGFLAQLRAPAALGVDGEVRGLEIRLLAGDPVAFQQAAIGPARFLSPFDPVADANRATCFVRVQPLPGGYPERPTSRIDPNSTFTVFFDEPMDVGTFEPYEALALTREALPLEGRDYVVGAIEASLALDEFSFVPSLPLAHVNGETEGIWLALGEGSRAPRDLAGNTLLDVPPPVGHRIDPDATTALTGGRVTRFSSVDEEPPFGDTTGPLPEWGGQLFFDLANERIRPRPVTRFQAVVDRTQPLPALMNPFIAGVSTPLSPFGAKTQSLWRYVDMGFSLSDPTDFNLDVEGLNWSPVGGQVTADAYSEFEIRLTHGRRLPDEVIETPSLFPKFPNSGLVPTYETNNLLFPVPAEVVHPRQRGYAVNPGDLFVSNTGTPLLPFPLNRGLPADQAVTFTWRDTGIGERGADNGGGADPEQVLAAGLPRQVLYSADNVETVGLPLLMEFRCYPDQVGLGLNAFDVSLAVNSSARPHFRNFSAGGIATGGNVVLVDPDLETQGNGGFNPGTGAPSAPRDTVFYIGAVDFVVRVSRVVSVWFTTEDTNGVGIPTPHFLDARIYPPAAAQPAGTSVEVAYRGADFIVGQAPQLRDAGTLDAYGSFYQPSSLHDLDEADANVAFIPPGDLSWSDSPIDGARYYQLRLTLRSNIATGLSPSVSSVGQAWSE